MMTDCPPSAPTVEYRRYIGDIAASPMVLVAQGNATANRNEAIAQTEKWQLDSLKAIAAIGRLGNNWDGYGSRPPTDAVRVWASDLVLQTNLGILPPPEFAPESDGGLEVDWRSGHNREIEFHVEEGRPVEYLLIQGGVADSSGSFDQNDRATVNTLLNWLRRG